MSIRQESKQKRGVSGSRKTRRAERRHRDKMVGYENAQKNLGISPPSAYMRPGSVNHTC